MKRLALCIGNDDYTILGKLECAVADAQAIESLLRNLGFDTILETNLDKNAMNNAILGAIDKMKDYDAFLLYYAGHGFQVAGDNILAPIDLSIEADERVIKHDAFPLGDLMEWLKDYPSKSKIIILDACRTKAGYRGGTSNFAPVLAPQGTLVAFSTSPGQGSIERTGLGHGYYTEALLKYMPLPRVPIETTFKKVREYLFAKTNGAQIPWEHTSLVGNFYFCPDTIYDGMRYSDEALADSKMLFIPSSKIKQIVEELKNYNYDTQNQAISKIYMLPFNECRANELFVLGRNVYQAADGGAFAAQSFIDNLKNSKYIPAMAQSHILTGMAYEIYFDSNDSLRSKFKTGYYDAVIKLLERDQYISSREYIASILCKIDDRPVYIPGQNEMLDFILKVEKNDENYTLTDIIYQGQSILFNARGNGKIDIDLCLDAQQVFVLKKTIASCVAIPKDMIRFTWDKEALDENQLVQVPLFGFSIRYKAIPDFESDEIPF